MKKIIVLIVCLFPFLGFSQFQEKFKEMNNIQNPNFEDYDELLFEATTYIFSHPINPKSIDFFYAVQIAKFWMNKDTGFGMPIFGDFYTKLKNENNQQFFYTIAMMHYNLIQKIEKNRLIKLVKTEGVKFSESPEVIEVQYGGAEILFRYAENTENNLPLNKESQNFIVAYRNGNLHEIMFKKDGF
jgi:hypothetical protein